MVIQTKIVNAVLASTLVASALVGFEMLATDRYLWIAAPTHALGLLAFTTLALVLAYGVVRLPARFTRYAKYAFLTAVLLSTAQLVLMVGDTIAGAPSGVPQAAFAAYLLNDSAFLVLLGIQPLVLLSGLAGTVPLGRRVRHVEAERTMQLVEVPATAN